MIKKILIGMVVVSVALSSSAMACCHTKDFKNSCNYKKIAGHSTTAQVIKAVSKTGINASQTKKIADGIEAYEATTAKIKKMKIFPVDSFIQDKFDEKRFIKEMSEKYIAAVAAKATLFKYVFSVLDKEQRKIFKREYAAPLIEHIVKSY